MTNFVANEIGGADSVGYALKSASGWKSYNGKTGGSDTFGFGALPVGYRTTDGIFYDFLEQAKFWNSTEDNAVAYFRVLFYFTGRTDTYGYNKGEGVALSVRCVKD